MAKYIVQHRRGTALQWASKDTIIPRAGEIVIEIDEENSQHKLKIGDGVHAYAELSYLMAGDVIVTQVLSKALPRVVTVTLDVNRWEEVTCETDPNLGYYSQPIAIDNITAYSRLDLQPSADMLAEFQNLNLVFTTENKDGIITIHSVGDMPLKSYTMQATIIETELNAESDKIVGAPVGTPTAKSDWNQTDETMADYIKNKPNIVDYVVEEGTPVVTANDHLGASTSVACSFKYRKWNSGILEIFGHFDSPTITFSVLKDDSTGMAFCIGSSSYQVLYFKEANGNNLFSNIPDIAIASNSSDTGSCIGTSTVGGTLAYDYGVMITYSSLFPRTGTDKYYNISLFVSGKWK